MKGLTETRMQHACKLGAADLEQVSRFFVSHLKRTSTNPGKHETNLTNANPSNAAPKPTQIPMTRPVCKKHCKNVRLPLNSSKKITLDEQSLFPCDLRSRLQRGQALVHNQRHTHNDDDALRLGFASWARAGSACKRHVR